MRFQPGMTGFCLMLALMLPGCGGDTDEVRIAAPLASVDTGVPAAAGMAAPQRYLADPELGDRLRKCFDTVLLPKHSGKSAEDIFATPLDAEKFQSSATLFQQACAGSMDPKDDCFQQVLKTFYKGEAHEKTLKFLQAQSQGSA